MKKSDVKPTWQVVMDRWTKHSVPRTAIFHREGEPGFQPERWVNRDGTECKHIYGNPVNDTGRHLAQGIVTQTPEVFAAFAINTFLMDRCDREGDLRLLTRGVLEAHDKRSEWYWTANSKNVLPDRDQHFREQGDSQNWTDRVDAAALAWTGISARFAVLKWSNEMNNRAA